MPLYFCNTLILLSPNGREISLQQTLRWILQMVDLHSNSVSVFFFSHNGHVWIGDYSALQAYQYGNCNLSVTQIYPGTAAPPLSLRPLPQELTSLFHHILCIVPSISATTGVSHYHIWMCLLEDPAEHLVKPHLVDFPHLHFSWHHSYRLYFPLLSDFYFCVGAGRISNRWSLQTIKMTCALTHT